LLKRLREGDQSALPVFRAMLDLDPDAIRGSDLARDVEEQILQTLAGEDLGARELYRHRMAALRAAVGGPDPSPLERLLVERIALNWLALHQAERDYQHKLRPGGGGVSLAHIDCLQRVMDRAHKRYLGSVMALAKVRKLGPEVLISVVQQVNVEAPESGPEPAPLEGLLSGRAAARN
jgi:hypothetical protein